MPVTGISSPAAEITIEANPTSVEAGRFEGFRAAGINRVSLGLQALDDAALKRLGRTHDVKTGLAALGIAKATFDRVSFDLIYARPDQSAPEWRRELRKRLPMVPLLDADQDSTSGPLVEQRAHALESYECQERLEQLEEVVTNGLSAEQRRLFELHHLEDRSIAEIAAELQKSEDAVKSNLYRTRKLLLAR